MKTLLKSLAVGGIVLSFSACSGNTSENKDHLQTTEMDHLVFDGSIEVVQFHNENRCMTCNKIEENSKETLKGIKGVSFRLVNVEDETNEAESRKFEAFGSSLYLHNKNTGAIKDLTDFAFMNAGNQDKFIEELKKEIAGFVE